MIGLSTSRLHWRPLQRGDETSLQALARDEHVRRYLLDGAVVPDPWAQREIERSAGLERLGWLGMGLVREHGGTAPIGFAGYRVFDEQHPEPQLVYAFLEPFAGRGYATEIARSLVEAAPAGPVYAAVDAPNRASIRVLEKLGFVRWNAWPGAFGRIDGFVLRTDATLTVARTWDGDRARQREHASVSLRFDLDRVIVDVHATHHGDPAPEGAPGPAERLWEHEVVEVFLLGDDDHYLEVELGPHGHHLVLELRGRRSVARQGMELDYHVSIGVGDWAGQAILPARWLPAGLARVNAYALHGVAPQRRYLACFPPAGAEPDFHRLEAFGSLTDIVRSHLLRAGTPHRTA